MLISFNCCLGNNDGYESSTLWYYTLTNRFKHQMIYGSFAQAFICIIIVVSTIFLSERSVYKLKPTMYTPDVSILSNRSRHHCIHFAFIKNIVEKLVHCIKLFLKRKWTMTLLFGKDKVLRMC